MNAQARAQKIESYAGAYTLLAHAVQQFPPAMWQFKPAPDQWSIHEILIHLSDSEVHSYIRCRTCIAEPGQAVVAYDECRWATVLRYHDQSPQAALDLIKRLHLRTSTLIQSLPGSVWAHTFEHPENGTLSLDDWLDIYERHIPDHIDQMKGVYAAWRAQTW